MAETRQRGNVATAGEAVNAGGAHPAAQTAAAGAKQGPTFPDPSITLIEFGDALGLLLATRTERDPENRRIVLSRVAHVRLERRGWGASPYPTVYVEQLPDGLYRAVEAQSKRIFPYPSRRRYEVGFISKDIFEAAVNCLKQRTIGPVYDLVAVTFGSRPDFDIEYGCLLGPEDYASEKSLEPPLQWTSPPPIMTSG